MPDQTTVTIIGAGPGGLTLATLLHRSGVDCVVLEARTSSYVEQGQRAGILDHFSGRIFEEYGLAEPILAEPILAGAPLEAELEFRVEGVSRLCRAFNGDVPGDDSATLSRRRMFLDGHA